MNDQMIKILKDLNINSSPYVDIRKLEENWDIHDKTFFTAFSELEEQGYISSKNTPDCGLEISADGIAQWSVVDLYVNDLGKDILSRV